MSVGLRLQCPDVSDESVHFAVVSREVRHRVRRIYDQAVTIFNLVFAVTGVSVTANCNSWLNLNVLVVKGQLEPFGVGP